MIFAFLFLPFIAMVNCHSTGRECDMYYGPANYPDYCMIEYFVSETEEKCLKKVPLFGDINKKVLSAS